MQLMPLPKQILQCGRLSLDLSQAHVMGILNVTPDSFSDGGKHDQKDQAVAYAKQMIADGATVIDVGGESTRPGASVVEIAEEIRRVVPVVAELAKLYILQIFLLYLYYLLLYIMLYYILNIKISCRIVLRRSIMTFIGRKIE